MPFPDNNYTGYNRTNNEDDDVSTGNIPLPMNFVVVNAITGIFAFAVVIADGIALTVLRRCTRIAFQTKYISISCILSDLVSAAVLFGFQIVIDLFRISNAKTHGLRAVTIGIIQGINWCSLTALSVDRAIALRSHLRYAEFVTRKVIVVVIIMIWLIYLTVVPAVTLFAFLTACEVTISNTCDDNMNETKIPRRMVVAVLPIYFVVMVISNIYVYRVARRHGRQVNAIEKGIATSMLHPDVGISERQFSAAKAVVTIVLSFILFNVNLVIHHIIHEIGIDTRYEQPRRYYYFVSYILVQISSFVNLALYVGKFKEFKYHMYRLLGNCCKLYNNRAEIVRVEVFNIVTTSESIQTKSVT